MASKPKGLAEGCQAIDLEPNENILSVIARHERLNAPEVITAL